MDYEKIISSKMKDMEVSPNKRKSMSVDALNNADHTQVSIDGLKRKYRSVDSVGTPDSNEETSANPPDMNEEIDVKLVRSKDRSQDARDPGERTIIFNKGGDIMGSQG